MITSVVMMCLDVLAALGDIYKAWTEFMNYLSVNSNMSQDILIEQIHLGREMYNIIKKTNATLSPFIVTFYTYFLFGGILYLYGTFDILFTEGNLKVQAMMLSCAFGIFAIIWFYALAMLSHVGERLHEEVEEAKDSFDDLFMDHCDESMSITLKNGWTGTRSRLEKVSISPYGYFEVHNSGLLATVATVLTYFIIVLQFRAS